MEALQIHVGLGLGHKALPLTGADRMPAMQESQDSRGSLRSNSRHSTSLRPMHSTPTLTRRAWGPIMTLA